MSVKSCGKLSKSGRALFRWEDYYNVNSVVFKDGDYVGNTGGTPSRESRLTEVMEVKPAESNRIRSCSS